MANRSKRGIGHKPPLGSTICASHPAANGLVGAWPFNEGGGVKVINSVINQASISNAQTYAWANGQYGSQINNTSGRFDFADNSRMNFTGDVTIVARMKTTIQTSLIYGGYSTVSPFTGVGFGVGIVTASRIGYWSSAKAAWVESTATCADGLWHTIGVSVAGTVAAFYLDGKFNVTVATNGAVAFASTKSLLCAASSGANPFNGSINYVYVYNRALPPTAMLDLHVDPFAMYQPPRRRMMTGTAAAGVAEEFAYVF